MANAEEQRGAEPSVLLPLEDGEAGMERPPAGNDGLIYPDLAPVVFRCLDQRSKFRRWCMDNVFSSWLNKTSVLVIILSCVVQGSYNPCVKDTLTRELFEAIGSVYFMLEMLMKMVALGVYGHKTSYLACKWNKLDLMLFIGEILDLLLGPCGIHLKFFTALRPMRLISRMPRMKSLVSIFLTITPMLLPLLLVFIIVVHVFGVVGVGLWAGLLQNRCFLGEDIVMMYNLSMSPYYAYAPGEKIPFLCSRGLAGLRHCSDIPPYRVNGTTCTLAAPHLTQPGNWEIPVTADPSDGNCVDWNRFYNVCRPDGPNPNRGSTNFDNIGYAWVTVFQVITLEGWSDVMYHVMDTHSTWSFVPFVLMTTLGSFFLMNTCAVVIASNFSETMKDPRFAVTSSVFDFKHYYQKIKRALDGYLSRRRSSRRNRGRIASARERLAEMVNTHFFEYGIMITVVLNIIILAIEHHGQSEGLTTALRVCNHVFTVVYTLEMVIKLMAFGMMYFFDRRNLFDFAIVMISLWDTGSKTGSKLTIVRVCRVLRFTKVLHFMPRLKSQLLVLWRSMQEASTLCSLTLFFIFMFSVMGMHSFGCKFTWPSQASIHDRKNFDSLLWSMVTVFQVLTQEDWNVVLYNAMASTSPWSALFFITILLLGRYVLFNILIGIVLQKFQTVQTETSDDASSSPPGDGADAAGQQDSAPKDECHHSLESGHEQDRTAEANHTYKGDRCLNLIRRWYEKYKDWPCFIIPPQSNLRRVCMCIIESSYFELVVTVLVVLNCITIAMERPSIDPESTEQQILNVAFYFFPIAFFLEIIIQVMAHGMVFGENSYFRHTWQRVEGLVVFSSMIHVVIMAVAPEKAQTFKILKFLRLLRVLYLFRLIKRIPGLRGALKALIVSVKPVANVALMSGIFFFFYSIVGVQLFKGKFYRCIGQHTVNIVNKSDCLAANYHWKVKGLNFDNILQALLSVFVMFFTDGWVSIMYDGLDAVGVDQQPIKNYNLWVLPYFLSFMVMSFFLLDMLIGVMVETFHACRRLQNQEEDPQANVQRHEDERRETGEEPTWQSSSHNSRVRGFLRELCTSKAMEVFVSVVIILNVLLTSVTHYNQPESLSQLIGYLNATFTSLMIIEVLLKLVAFGVREFAKDRWNLMDFTVILASTISVILSQMNIMAIPFCPTILRICSLLRPNQVLSGKNTRVLLGTIISSLSQVWSVSLLFLFFFATFAALGVELFGKLECSPEYPCLGLHRYGNFSNFLMALLTLYRVCTGDNWNGILKDTMRNCRPDDANCQSFLVWVSPIYFTGFVIVSQFVLLNLLVAIIMQALEDNKRAKAQQNRRVSPAAEQPSNVSGEGQT